LAIERLEPFIGAWNVHASFPRVPGSPEVDGQAHFEWTLDRRFLVQRSTVDHPDAPDFYAIVAPSGDGYTQHYFDSRGVVRLYSMTFDGTTWTMLRDSEDFSPLDFAQRFSATFGDDARTISGAWEIREHEDWQHDFDVTYTRIAS
jgi:hypothetical protein